MCKAEYYSLTSRLKSIRVEIAVLKDQPINSIKERIQILKETNILLREQNKILLLRQQHLSARNDVSNMLRAS